MEEIKEKLKFAIKNLYNLDFEPEITPSPDNIDADYSTNAPLKLAKDLHKNPMTIAEELLEAFANVATNGELLASEPRNDRATKRATTELARLSERGSSVTERDGRERSGSQKASTTPPGFLNFNLDDKYLTQKLNNLCNDFETEIKSTEFSGKTVICEFSDPNPFKVLHVGHLYTSIVGDSISRLYEYAGANVIRANFGGDVGLHVAKTSYALLRNGFTPDNLTIEDVSKCYVEGTAAYDEDEQAHAEITRLNKEIYKINAEGIHGTELADLYWKGRELSYGYFNNFYASIGVKFDKYYPESTVAALGLETVKKELAAGVYEESDGAVVFKGEPYGLHTRVFINKEGVPTYEAKDVGLIFTKDKDYHFDKSVVITGNEQSDYMKVVLKSVEQYAKDLVDKTSHLTHGLVKLPGNVKMSSRKGNFLKAVDVLDLVEDELKSAYNSTDEKVSLAATKYAFLKYKMGGDIIFDPKESVKMTGNSGPYLLYSSVRAKKILAKGAESARRANVATNGELLASEPRNDRATKRATTELARLSERGSSVTERDGPERSGSRVRVLAPHEKNIIKKLLEYKTLLNDAVAEMAPHKVAGYLYELAQDFSRFYENCQVAGSDEEAERMKIVKVYLETMTHGLSILGIEIPEEM